MQSDQSLVIIGAGPAGLTAAVHALRINPSLRVTVLEADDVVGGISRTVEANGWRFDIGGHRFFTKVKVVEEFWRDILSPEDFLSRPRLSRIFYDGKFYDYPLKPLNALKNLGFVEALKCVTSYFLVRIRPPRDRESFEGWVASRFGWRLYRTFFKTYTEKVWGIPATEIRSDWAAQRIKNLSLGKAIVNAMNPRKGSKKVTSLIDRFDYPKFGPGMMWEACRNIASEMGAEVLLNHRVVKIRHSEGRAFSVVAQLADGELKTLNCSDLISTMPIGELMFSCDPRPPQDVLEAASNLRHRDFITVALVVPSSIGFEDNWIYIHSSEVRVGRIQNFGSWSPFMVKEGMTCLGLEYFVFEHEPIWHLPDKELIAFATSELKRLNLIPNPEIVSEGFVVRMPKAYPIYDGTYDSNLRKIRDWMELNVPNITATGRNGLHRYNNQDHSMLTSMFAVENLFLASNHDVWSVNVEDDYHEERTAS